MKSTAATQLKTVTIEIGGKPLASVKGSTIDRALQNITNGKGLCVQDVCPFREVIPYPKGNWGKKSTLKFRELLDALAEDAPTQTIEAQFPRECSHSGMIIREIVEHAFYGDQSHIKLIVEGRTAPRPLIYRAPISKRLPMGLFLWAMPLPFLAPSFWVTDMENGGISSNAINFIDSHPGNFIGAGKFLYPTRRVKAVSVTELEKIATFLEWGLSFRELSDLKQYCDQAQ